MKNKASRVISAVVVAAGTPMLHPKNPLIVVRYHTVRVLEVFKEDLNSGAHRELRLMQYGGTINVAGTEVSTDYVGPLLANDDEVVLFLKQEKGSDAYTIAYGSVGLFKLNRETDRLSIPVVAQRMVEINGHAEMSRVDFLDLVRHLKNE